MRCTALILVCLALGGCATTGYATGGRNEIGYEKFHDSYGDQKIVSRNNDLYLEKLDGSESRKLTNTPDLLELWPRFIENGKKIIYAEWHGKQDIKIGEPFSESWESKHVLIPYYVQTDYLNKRIQISHSTFFELLHKRNIGEY